MQYINDKNSIIGKNHQAKENSDPWSNIFIKLHQTWLKYCCRLLKHSKRYVEERKKANYQNLKSGGKCPDEDALQKLSLITENDLPCRFLKDDKLECPNDSVKEYSGARILFLIVRNSSRKLMNKTNDEREKIEISKLMNNLYKTLAFYEGQRFLRDNTYNRLSKMHKRRVTLWKSLVDEYTGNNLLK